MMDGGSQHRWGNHLGYLIINIPMKQHLDPLDYVRAAKKVTDRKKASLEGVFTYWSGAMLMGLTGPKVSSLYQTQRDCYCFFFFLHPPPPKKKTGIVFGSMVADLRLGFVVATSNPDPASYSANHSDGFQCAWPY
jgi:hypothetical protein